MTSTQSGDQAQVDACGQLQGDVHTEN